MVENEFLVLIVESMYLQFREANGIDYLLTYVQSLHKPENVMINFMNSFSAVSMIRSVMSIIDTSSSLITAINCGYTTIANCVYFENQISLIAKQIVDLEEWEVDPEYDDVTTAVSCLNHVRKTAMMLSDEEKDVIKQAVNRIGNRGCSCSIL